MRHCLPAYRYRNSNYYLHAKIKTKALTFALTSRYTLGMEKHLKYTVGTSETGGFVGTYTLVDARNEARSWARSEPGVYVNIWEIDQDGVMTTGDPVNTYYVEPEQQAQR